MVRGDTQGPRRVRSRTFPNYTRGLIISLTLDPYHATFFVGGSDAIVDGYRVKRYLENHGISDGLHWDPKGVHGAS